MTLIELAIAFVHPPPGRHLARSSARAPWSSSSRSSPARRSRLTADVLDRIDEIVAPGVTINPDDNSYGTTELRPGRATPAVS